MRFWTEKIATNRRRDRRVDRQLRKMGYAIIRIWEHELCAR
jgi:DNA mismatch endonuclease (patch repair protein)